jgi:uncharacterized protein (DUF433 family)
MAQRTGHVVTRSGAMGGEPHIEGRRVTVLHLYEQVEGRGCSPRTVAARHDLDIADVYRALAYYHEHPKEMSDVRNRREELVETHRERTTDPDAFDTSG